MHIYFIGIGGVAIGPLARMARDVGYSVSGSDIRQSRYTDSVQADGIPVSIGSGVENIASIHAQRPIDWVVYTSAAPADSPELNFARERGIRTSKRDTLINHILREKNLKMLAVAGTHGKTTSTGMLIWAFYRLKIPVSYSVGSNISWAANGKYQQGAEYFIYEADEFDKNFLNFHPDTSIITSLDFDHPETYSNLDEYKDAFKQFVEQSNKLFTYSHIAQYLNLEPAEGRKIVNVESETDFTLPGVHNRQNAKLVFELLKSLDVKRESKLRKILNGFPGTERRMELIVDNLYSDYAHHPVEIRATLQAAKEINQEVIAIYQPHQNRRQIQLKDQYLDSFADAQKVYWLPTFLSREGNDQVIPADDLIASLDEPQKVEKVELNDQLYDIINMHREAGHTVVMMSAGNLDDWARQRFIG